MTRSRASIGPWPPAVGLLACLLASTGMRADVIRLRNGNEIHGEVVEEGAESVTVRFSGGTLELRRRDVEEIRRQDPTTFLLQEGEKRLVRKDYRGAVETFERVLAVDPDSEVARRRIADARMRQAGRLRELHRYDESLLAYQRLAAEHPRNEAIREAISAIREEQAAVAEEERLARAELAGGDLETAIWRLQNLHDRYPDRREAVGSPLAEALERRARELHASGDWESAAARLDDVLVVDPERVERVRELIVDCAVRRIEPLVHAGRHEEMERIARSALAAAPSSLPLTYLLGLASEGQGDLRQACDLYAAILGTRRPSRPESAVQSMRQSVESLLAGGDDATPSTGEASDDRTGDDGFRILETDHFVILHRNEKLARELGFVAERGYARLFRELDCKTHWKTRCKIRVHPTREAYLREATLGDWSGAAHRLAASRGAFSEHAISTYEGQPRLADGLLVHEIAHALLLHRLNYPETIPLWANEGFAVRCEPPYLREHYGRLVGTEAGRASLIPLADLVSATEYPQDDVDLFYGQSHGVVSWLIERGGVQRFVAFLRSMTAEGKSLESALDEHYRIESVLALENRWRRSLR